MTVTRPSGRPAGSSDRQRRPRSSGFTLIELLVAVALMAVLAILSWRGLDAILQSREQLVARSDELRALTLALSQLDEDLKHAAALRPLDLPEQEIRVEMIGDSQQQALMLLREVNRLAMPTRLQRVFYEVRNGILMRGFTEWQQASYDGSQTAGVGAIVWQPILANVAAIRFRGWITNTSAMPVNRPPGAAGPGDGTLTWLDAAQLATQIEMIQTQRGQWQMQRIKLWQAAVQQGQTYTPQPRTGLAAREVTGLEMTVLRADGQRFVRVYSAVD